MNPRVYCVLLMTALVALFVEQQVGASIIGDILLGKYNAPIYNRINKHLEKEFPYEADPSANLKHAIDWLEKRISSAEFSIEKNSLSTVSNQLKALEGLKDDERCNLDSLKVLEANNRATNGQALKFHDEFNPKRRIVSLVLHYFLLHAESCKKHYADLLTSDSGIDKRDVKTVQIIGDGFVNAYIEEIEKVEIFFHDLKWIPQIKVNDQLTKLGDWHVENLITVFGSPLSKVINPDDILKYLSREDPDKDCMKVEEGKIVSQLRIKKLFKEYMVGPCRNYIRHKHDVWKVLQFDHKFLNMYRKDFKLLKAIIGHKICEDIVGQDQKAIFESIINSLKESRK